ncbi:MAG: protein kinase [Cyanobacteria bacterium SZAS LIN-5]|nr:protein kinase [Cyanobacteria bacterium SZAS LIN-5]
MLEDNSLTVTRKTCTACNKDFFRSVGVCPNCGATDLVEVKRDAFIGKVLAGRYQVESLLGTGGMGVVYKAWQENLKRRVAIKVLRQQFLEDQTSVKRFQQEAIAASRLAHPNIVTLHDFGSTEDGYIYMVMDIINGKSLAQEMRDRRSIGVERTINIVTQVCDALDHAHRNGIVHRDLKPGNIMLVESPDGGDYVKLVDFGIAKVLESDEDQELTQKGDVFGSPLYMSPEQCLGHDLDGRSDIYSLATVMYECLTGCVPHKGRNAIETIDKQIHQAPASFAEIRPDIYIPERLEAVVMKALAKSPAARQQTMKELAAELQASVPRKNEARNLRARIDPVRSASLHNGIVRGGLAAFICVGLVAGFLGFKNFVGSKPPISVPPQDRTGKLVPPQSSPSQPTPSPGNPAMGGTGEINAQSPTTPINSSATPSHAAVQATGPEQMSGNHTDEPESKPTTATSIPGATTLPINHVKAVSPNELPPTQKPTTHRNTIRANIVVPRVHNASKTNKVSKAHSAVNQIKPAKVKSSPEASKWSKLQNQIPTSD